MWTDWGLAQAANLSREQHHPILTFMTAKRYRPQFLISCIFMLFQQFDGAPDRARFCARNILSLLCVITLLVGWVGLGWATLCCHARAAWDWGLWMSVLLRVYL